MKIPFRREKNRKPVTASRAGSAPRSAEEWMPKSTATTPEFEKKEAMRKWHGNNEAHRNKLSNDAEYKRMDDNAAKAKRDYQQTRNQGNMVTSENGRAIETGRM